MPTYKTANKKLGKLTAKLVEEPPWNILFVDLIGPYKIHKKGKEPIILKVVIIIDPFTEWFEVTQYSDKKATTTANLVKTLWMV